jgi:hypothetical protein
MCVKIQGLGHGGKEIEREFSSVFNGILFCLIEGASGWEAEKRGAWDL